MGSPYATVSRTVLSACVVRTWKDDCFRGRGNDVHMQPLWSVSWAPDTRSGVSNSLSEVAVQDTYRMILETLRPLLPSRTTRDRSARQYVHTKSYDHTAAHRKASWFLCSYWSLVRLSRERLRAVERVVKTLFCGELPGGGPIVRIHVLMYSLVHS